MCVCSALLGDQKEQLKETVHSRIAALQADVEKFASRWRSLRPSVEAQVCALITTASICVCIVLCVH